jgi:hypothetical protein
LLPAVAVGHTVRANAGYAGGKVVVLFRAIYGSITGSAAVVFAIIALRPTRAVREYLAERITALGGAITFGALALETARVVSFKILVAPVIVGGLVSSVGALLILKQRRKALMPPDDPDTTQG